MLNWIWGSMIVAGTVYAILTGNTQAAGESLMEGAEEAVGLVLTMAGILGVWCGLMEIAEKSGLMQKITKMLKPFVTFMFPDIPEDHKALKYISINFAANIFGLSGAATPSGIKAMKELQKLKDGQQKAGRKNAAEMAASKEMCTFLVINISSLQLIPISMVAYRSQYGSVHPAAVTSPAIIATLISTLTAILFCKIMCKLKRD